jgi:hypothetical protein
VPPRSPKFFSAALAFAIFTARVLTAPFDAAPFAVRGNAADTLVWEDPRELHEVTVEFAEPPADDATLRLEYWGSRWPQQHFPKDKEPGGGDVGWAELGNWFNGGWRTADAVVKREGKIARFTFHPINASEFPDLKDYASKARYTLKVRVAAAGKLPAVRTIQAFTDSRVEPRGARVAWRRHPQGTVSAEAFNGRIRAIETHGAATTLHADVVVNPDPNTLDRTLVTVQAGPTAFTFKVDDLADGPIYLPEFGAAILPEADKRDFAAVESDVKRAGRSTLYDRVAGMPEQTWGAAWAGMPPKKSRICFVLGLDGARQKFRLDGNGEVFIRWNDQFMKGAPARDTARLDVEKPPVHFRFGLPESPTARSLEEESIPTCITRWERDGVGIVQTAFATPLNGADASGGPPDPDVFAVAMLRFEFTNTTDQPRVAALPVTIRGGEAYDHLRVDDQGLVWNGAQVRGQISATPAPTPSGNVLDAGGPLPPHGTRTVVVKMPYLALAGEAEADALVRLDFDHERRATGDYWRATLDRSARLTTPEPVLNQFYRATPGHLLINSEFDPGSRRRFPRVGSFNYGNYGNESCMMVLDLDRRGYHREAEESLEGWLHYQGTVGLPGDFDTKEGVLYGCAGYESGGYNQHHGWILWTLAEHYRFTRDKAWLDHAAPGMIAGARWIIRETARTAGRGDLSEGLLPPGDLEDIGDWWTWLSTSCYTWRGLDAAAWALEQLGRPEAREIRTAADRYHRTMVDNFAAASLRSPVVRLRDGTAVPQIPSYVQRRGRSFGWIIQTLEGSMHLIITGAIDAHSRQAEWILKDYEDNLYLSNQYGYTVDDFDRWWFGRGGMSMQACLLLDPEAYLARDDVKQALRAIFNAIAVNHFPDVHMNTEHALPEMGDWRGDHYKTSDEANACGWLRYLFVREEGERLWIGQAVPREWLAEGKTCGIENTATWFGPVSATYSGGGGGVITAELKGPVRNPPKERKRPFEAM